MEPSTHFLIDGPDSPPPSGFSDHPRHDLPQSLLSRSSSSSSAAMDEPLYLLRRERDEAVSENTRLLEAIADISRERDSLSLRIRESDASLGEKQSGFETMVEEEPKKSNGFLLKLLGSLRLASDGLVRIVHSVAEEEKVGDLAKESDGSGLELELDGELRPVSEEVKAVTKLVGVAEAKVEEYKESRKKEKRELENSVVSLTEENRDINSLLRIALVEKEAVEKRKNEQKRVALLQIAERGLQRVGFGFIMGGGSGETSSESSGTKLDASGTKSDGSECEEEVVSLVLFCFF